MIEQRDDRTGGRVAMVFAACGLVAAGACAVAAWVEPADFFPAYLAGVMWVWSLSVGGIALGLLHHLTGGRWGEAGRPWFETASRSMPLVLLMAIPLAFGLSHLYPWVAPDYFDGMERIDHRRWYLRPTFFLIRATAYFGIWIVLSLLVGGLPRRHRRQRDIIGGQATAGLAAIALLLTITWAGFDWLMSIRPHFVSTLFGALVGIGTLLSATAFTVAGTMLAMSRQNLPQPHRQKIVSDLGNLLLTMVLLWTYLSFSQFLLMWSGNLPEEASYYQDRSTGGWQFLSMTLAAGGFVVPLALMLSPRLKQSPRPLGLLGGWLVLLRLLELDWFVLPYFSPRDAQWNWCHVAVPVAVGGLWLAFVCWDLPPSVCVRSSDGRPGS